MPFRHSVTGSVPAGTRRIIAASGTSATPNLEIPGGHEGLKASDDEGRPIPRAVEPYRKSDRLNPFGFSGLDRTSAAWAREVRLRAPGRGRASPMCRYLESMVGDAG